MAAGLTAVTPPAQRGAALTVAAVDPAAPGVRVSLDVDPITLTGTLVDEFGMAHAAEVHRADDDLTASLIPAVALPAGLYLAAITIDAEDLELAPDTVTASIEVSANPFDAVLEDAAGFLTVPVTPSSTPTRAEALGFVADIAARVDVRLARRADLTGAADLDAVEAAARGVIALGVAAMIVDARHPEKVTSQADSRYGAVLWQRYTEALTALTEDLGARLAAGGVVAAGGHAAASFPPPGGWAGRGF